MNLLGNIPNNRVLITTADDSTTASLLTHITQSSHPHNHHNVCKVFCLFEANPPPQHHYEMSKWDQTGCTIVITTSAVASYHRFTDHVTTQAVINYNAHTSFGTHEMNKHATEYYKSNKYVKYLDEQEGLVDKMKRQYLKRVMQHEEELRQLAQQAEEKRRAKQQKQRQLALQAEEQRRAEQRKQEQRQLERREEERRRAAWRRYNAATTIFCWWRRRQLDNHFKKMKEKSTAATIIFCWWRRKLLRAYFEKHRAARIIQLWNRRCMFRIRCKRRSIINHRKQLKLEAAARSSAFRDRGQPLPPINHRQRYRRNQRARRQRNSKRSRPSRKRGQPRGRPPNPTQPQQSQQQSIKRRENELGIALSNSGRSSIRGSVIGSVHNNSSGLKTAGPYVLGRDLRRRDSNGRVTALGTALQSSELSSKESVIGKTLQGNESSSRGNTAETPQQDSSESHRSSTQPISSLKIKSSRRRRRRRRRRKHPQTTHHQKDEASPSTRHTPTYPSSDAHLPNISDLCDGIRRQLHLASSSDRNLLKFVCQLVLQHIDNQITEPSSIIDKIESPSTSTSVNNNPSSTTNNESFSSIKNVDSHTPKSTTTTKLTELPCSVFINTEETTTRHEKPVTYLHALIGTTSNFG